MGHPTQTKDFLIDGLYYNILFQTVKTLKLAKWRFSIPKMEKAMPSKLLVIQWRLYKCEIPTPEQQRIAMDKWVSHSEKKK
jgi:hypothetical protein